MQAELLLQLTPKLMEDLKEMVKKKSIENTFITVSQFIEKFIPEMEK